MGGDEKSHLKSLVTDDALDNRESYGRAAVTREMTAILVGTTNNGSFLTDHDHRRTPVLEIPEGRQIDIPWLKAHRDQIWAQAVHELDLGRWWEPAMDQQAVRMPEHLWDDANEHSKQFELTSDLDVWLESTLGRVPWGTAVLALDLLSARKAHHIYAGNKEFSQAMDAAGWLSFKWNGDGRSVRAWKRRGDSPRTQSLLPS